MLKGGEKKLCLFLLEHGRKKMEEEEKIVEIFSHFFPIDVLEEEHRPRTFSPSSFLHLALPLFLFFAPEINEEDIPLAVIEEAARTMKETSTSEATKESAAMADLSDLLAEKLDLDLDDAPGGASSSQLQL